MELRNLIGSALTVRGRPGRSNRAASRRGIRLAPLLLVAVMLAAVAMLAETSNPAQTVHAHEGDDHRHFSCPGYSCTYADVPAELTLWSTTMTVAESTVLGVESSNEKAGYTSEGGTLGTTQFIYQRTTYSIERLQTSKQKFRNTVTSDNLILTIEPNFPSTFHDDLTLELNGQKFLLSEATRHNNDFLFSNHGLTWTENESVAVKLVEPHPPNAYGYRTIWTALMTAGNFTGNSYVGYSKTSSVGDLTNNLIVDGRDETVTIGTDDQPRYPWTGYEIKALADVGGSIQITFDSVTYPSTDELAGWTLTLGGGVELPFAQATPVHISTPHNLTLAYNPTWTAGDQVVVSIRNDEVQNRAGEVKFKVRRHTGTDASNNIVYGKTHFSYDHEPDKFGPASGWELLRLNVTTDKTGDTDPVWISATFRAHGSGAAGRAWQGYWEGEFDDFHTLFLSWAYSVDGAFEGGTTYTLPLKAAAAEGGIGYRAPYDGRPDNFYVTGGPDVTFTWVRTYKEFKDKHLDLANHGGFSAHMLAPPQPATARLTVVDDGPTQSNVYDPVTVKNVRVTSNPGSDQVYGPGSTIEVTVTFSDDVTVGYKRSKKYAAEIDLELGDQTRTAHYDRTEGKKVIFKYTVVPGDNAPVALRIPVNSLRLYRDKPSEDGSIRDSEGRDAHLGHSELVSQAHRVDAVSPQLAGAEVSTDGTQVAVTFDEDMQSPAIWRAFGVQTSLLQSLALDVRVDGELAARSDAAVSGDTVTLTMSEPVTQGQTVAVSYDNLFVETGESILEDLYGNNLLTFTEQPATNGSTLADVDRPDGGLALSRTDLKIDEGESGTYTVALASQPAADVTVAIGQRPPGRATVSPASLTFTADNWNTPQTVTITSTEDANYVDRWVLLRHVATGDDYGATAAAWLILRDTYNVGTTPANIRATGSPTIDGTPQVDHTLTVDTSDIADADGLTHASYTWLYQWLRGRSEIRGATDSTYTLGLADKGHKIRVKVSFTDDANNQESRTSAPTVAVAPPPNTLPTGVPAINGTPQVGETLTVDTSEINDADGMEESVFLYQWLAKNSIVTLELVGEHNPTYTPSPAEEGFAIMVRVTFTDDRGHSETLTSAATVAVARPPNYEPTGLPAISGTPQVGETLTADTSAIDDADGLTNVAYQYQWLGNQSVLDANTGTYYYINVEIPGETGSTYTLAPADKGRTFAVRVSFTDDRGNSESLSSRSTVVVAAKPNSEPTGLPAIDGTPQVGQTLTADTSAIDDADGLTTVSYEYRWFAIKTVVDENTGFSLDVISLLSGDTSSTYTLGPADAGYTFTVRVTFTDDEGNNESLTSEATEAVAATAPTAPQSLSVATGDQDQELDVTWQAPSSNGGSEVTGYKVQWKEAAESWDTEADVSEATETGTTYTITGLTGGVEYAVRVIATNDVGDGPASTEAKGTPAGGVSEQAENSAPTGLPGIGGTPQVDQTLTADTSPIDDEDGLTNVSYSYQWIAGGSDIAGATGSTYTLTSSDQGQTIQVRVTFTDDADNEETLTSAATEAVAAAGPAPLTAGFQDLPDSHDGSTAFTFRVLFSEDVGISYVNMRDDAFSLSEGDVTGARRVDGRDDLWEITVEPDDNSDVGITLPANRSCTTTGAICTREDSPRQLTNSPTATVTGPAEAPPTNTSAAGAPTISGTPQVGQTLTADTSSITDEDGLTNVSYSYQWIAGGSDIAGATGSTYTLTSSEQGQTVQVRVTFTDDADNEETLTSEATAEVTAAPAPLTASRPDSRFQSARHNGAGDWPQVIVAFSMAVASFEKTTPSVSLTGAAVSSVRRHQEDGLDNAWIFFLDPDGNGDIVLSLVTGRPCDSGGICTEDGEMLSEGVQVTLPGPDEEGEPDNPEPDDPNSPATGKPTIGGTPQVGQTLTADTANIVDQDGLTGVSYTYQWIAGGTDIDGATGASYTLTASEQGQTIQLRVAFTDDAGNAETLTSIATAAVAAAPEPLTVRLKVSAPATHDGSSEFTFEIEFSEEFGLGYATLRDHAFNVTGGSVETAQRTDKPSNISWRITVKPQGNGDVTIELPATTDCGATGAICTGDGRKLSNSLSFTVSGPGQ